MWELDLTVPEQGQESCFCEPSGCLKRKAVLDELSDYQFHGVSLYSRNPTHYCYVITLHQLLMLCSVEWRVLMIMTAIWKWNKAALFPMQTIRLLHAQTDPQLSASDQTTDQKHFPLQSSIDLICIYHQNISKSIRPLTLSHSREWSKV